MKIFLRVQFIILILLQLQQVTAQSLDLNIGFFGFADNREFKNPYVLDKTIFGSGISPTLAFKINDQHQIVGGLHFYQDFGQSKQQYNSALISYYQYQHKGLEFAIGNIPRLDLLQGVDRLVQADTFFYYRPNIEGMAFSFQKNKSLQRFWIDWTSKQSYENKEQFLLGAMGKVLYHDFYFEHNISLHHQALTSNKAIDEHVRDNAIAVLKLGYEKNKFGPLDSLNISAGIVQGMDRHRTIYDWRFKRGILLSIYAQVHQVFLNNSLYRGDAQDVIYGDPFYRNSHYNRTELGWYPFQTAHVKAKLSAILHFTPGYIDNQQQFSILYTFGSKLIKSPR